MFISNILVYCIQTISLKGLESINYLWFEVLKQFESTNHSIKLTRALYIESSVDFSQQQKQILNLNPQKFISQYCLHGIVIQWYGAIKTTTKIKEKRHENGKKTRDPEMIPTFLFVWD